MHQMQPLPNMIIAGPHSHARGRCLSCSCRSNFQSASCLVISRTLSFSYSRQSMSGGNS